MLNSYFQGLMIGLSLIIAIGAQNALILKQGLIKQHVFVVCLICAISDSVLIILGVFGFSKLMMAYPAIMLYSKYIGAIFLFIYGAKHFYQVVKNQKTINLNEPTQQKCSTVIMTCLALTWLNPHVYLDTMILIGNLSTQFVETQFYFVMGAITASWLFFYSLGYAARLLIPFFTSQISWKILDFLIALLMWGIAISLLN